MNNKENTCCFTGHRVIPPDDIKRIEELTKIEIVNLINNGVSDFITGGASGYDTLCAFIIVELKSVYPIKLHIALPCGNHADKWQDADSVTYVSEFYHKGCMQKRNRYMVDNSQYCIAYCTKQSGGSFYTMKYALKNNSVVINIQ